MTFPTFTSPLPTTLKQRLLCWALLALTAPATVLAGESAHQKKLKLDTTATGTELKEAVTQLPLLVRLHSGNFAFNQAKPDGSDLRVLAPDGKTPLRWQLENYDAANELANVWVMVPKVAASTKADVAVVGWGGDAAAAANSGGFYDTAQRLVYHFSDAQGVRDSTANGNHAQTSTAKAQPLGPAGGALTFDGSARVVVPASASLKFVAAEGLTVSAWLKPSTLDDASLLSLGGQALSIGLANGRLSVRSGSASATATAGLKPGLWQHVAVVLGEGQARFFIDGLDAGAAPLAMAEAAGELVIGDGLRGELDELGLAATPRSAAYLRALAGSQAADTPMVALDDDAAGGESVSYAAVLIGSVTLDGWIVIGVLAVMALVSAWVMVSKSVLLSRSKRGNAAFLDRFRADARALLSPGHALIVTLQQDAALRRSPLFRLYTTGLAEIAQRFDEQTAAGQPLRLKPAGLEAIRAALDAANLRENQRLNGGIVLLTIAISGGPFLGLLGTVVGVMITFAAIAVAGDVNVNAIAPGIAAALVATVAGLAVAIPALFGYNWLASQIKNLSGDSQVFLDQFVTKSAEQYAD
jgi:biopolymer transport protein ExbB